MPTSYRLTLLRILSLLAVVALSVYIFSIREKAEELAKIGRAHV